jgi:cyclophilin family peptidyl-prolyl cis-trans isomerase
VTDPQSPQSRGIEPWLWVLIAVVLVAGAVGSIFAVALARSDSNDTVSATGSTLPNETVPNATGPTNTAPPQTAATTPVSLPPFLPDPAIAYTATISTNLGDIEIAMDTKNAPKGASRFIQLAKAGFYDGLTFHRASKDFVIQGGDPSGDGSGGTGTSVVGETPTDNYPIGSLAAAKTQTDPPGTFDCQFFIVTGSGGSSLPNDYARFGTVTKGLDVAQKIEALAPPQGDGPPTQTVTISSVKITEAPA